MKFRRKIAMALCVCLCLGSSTIVSSAQEIQESEAVDTEPTDDVQIESGAESEIEAEMDAEPADETTELEGNGAYPAEEQRLQNVTGMDENGNIYPLEKEDGIVADPIDRTRAATGKIVNFNTKGWNVTNYKEVTTGEAGYTCGAYGADAAYLGTANGKIKFMLAGVVGEVNSGDVQVVDISKTKSMSYYYVKNSYLYHYITTNMNSTSYSSTLNNGKAPSYLSEGVKYYSYDGHYFYTYNNYSYIQSDYNGGNRSHSVNNNPHFNYFQYLPMRSKVSYSGTQFQSIVNNSQVKNYSNSKLRDLGDDFVAVQNDFGVNALLAFGVAVNESAWGTSSIAQRKNNLFGLNAVDSSPGTSADTYASPQACVKDFANGWMSRGYLYPDDWRYFGGFLGNKASGINVKYASDPYWGEKAANIAWSVDVNNGSKEASRYSLGIKDIINSTSAHTALNVRKEATTASAALYSTGAAGTYSFIILGESGGFYKVQSDGVLTSGRNSITKNSGYYDYGRMYAYTSMDYVTKIAGSNGGTSEPDINAEGINYSVHAQTYGWMPTRMDGQMAGTEGEAKRLEAIKISLRNPSVGGSVKYRTHVQSYGWTDWKTDGAISGTEGEAKRMEAIQIQLTGAMADKYDIYYRVHSQTYGWLDWAKNGEMAGSSDSAKRMESIEIKLVKKGGSAPGGTKKTFVQPLLQYSTHAQTYGWQSAVAGGAKAGTEGEAKRLEAIKLSLVEQKYAGNIEYRVHVQTHGWMPYVKNGAIAGTSGQAKRMEAVQIRLSGEMANKYDVYYRVHSQSYGWLGWAKNGQSAGTEGLAKRMEAVQIIFVAKGAEAPGSTENYFVK